MGDSSGAELFGKIFNRLAKDPIDDRNKKLAQWFWKESRGHDFCDSEMECDDALIKFKFAKPGRDPDCPEEEVTLYKRDGRWQPY